MEFGQILRELIEDRDLSQKQVAEDLNIAVTTLGNYIRGNHQAGYELLRKMAAYFDVSIDYLLNYQHKETKCHDEDHLLKIYRSLSPEFQSLLLDEGRLFLKHNKRLNP